MGEKKLTALQEEFVKHIKGMYQPDELVKTTEMADVMQVAMPKVRGCLAGLYKRGIIKKTKGGFTLVA